MLRCQIKCYVIRYSKMLRLKISGFWLEWPTREQKLEHMNMYRGCVHLITKSVNHWPTQSLKLNCVTECVLWSLTLHTVSTLNFTCSYHKLLMDKNFLYSLSLPSLFSLQQSNIGIMTLPHIKVFCRNHQKLQPKISI